MDARIDMPAPIAVGPAVKGALPHRGQIIGDELGAEFVAFVDDRPEHVRGRFEGESGRVADARHIGAVRPGRGVDLPDHRAILDRTSVWSGRSVSVRLDLGGRVVIKKKKYNSL